MLDHYVMGTHTRNSPEADIAILDYTNDDYKLGGAGNVAINLKALRLKPFLISVTGKDTAGKKMKSICKNENIEHLILQSDKRTSTEKIRYVKEDFTQFLRVDIEKKKDISKSVSETILKKLKSLIKADKVSSIIIQDYNKGVVTKKLIKDLQKLSTLNNIPLLTDPKNNNFKLLSQAHTFKPNLKELESYMNKKIRLNKTSIFNALRNADLLNNKYCFVTLADKGMFYHSDGNFGIVKGKKVKNADVSGAGDTVIAVLSALTNSQKKAFEIAKIANKCGAFVVKQHGIASMSLKEFRRYCK